MSEWLRNLTCVIFGHSTEITRWRKFGRGWIREMRCTRCDCGLHIQMSRSRFKPLDIH